jgi:hypothetical protein
MWFRLCYLFVMLTVGVAANDVPPVQSSRLAEVRHHQRDFGFSTTAKSFYRAAKPTSRSDATEKKTDTLPSQDQLLTVFVDGKPFTCKYLILNLSSAKVSRRF